MKRIIRLTEDDLSRIVKKVASKNKFPRKRYDDYDLNDDEEFKGYAVYDRGYDLERDGKFIEMCVSLSEKLKLLVNSPNYMIAKYANNIYEAIETVEDYAYDTIENLEPDHIPYFTEIKSTCLYIIYIRRNDELVHNLDNKCEKLKEYFKKLIQFLDNYTY